MGFYKIAKKIYVNARALLKRNISPSKPTLKAIKKYSNKFGFDRGTPLDLFYMMQIFDKVDKYKSYQNSLEFGDLNYSKLFNTKNMFVLTHPEYANGVIDKNQIVFDLNSSNIYNGTFFDLIISTNVINFTHNPFVSIKHHFAMLNDNGTLVLTVQSSMPVSDYDQKRWGDYWRLTMDSLAKLLEGYPIEYELYSFGSFTTSIAFLCGIAAEELELNVLDEHDHRYPIGIGAIIKKLPKNASNQNI